jgi:hypothetical protein
MHRKKQILFLLLVTALVLLLAGCPAGTTATQSAATTATTELTPTRKPALYLYPAQVTNVRVRLVYQGQLTCTYPAYEDGWDVLAFPDGRLINLADGCEYSYLYWEGETSAAFDFSQGFVVRGEDTAAFLQEKLAFMGLLPREYNEFIVYWLPEMQKNPYNLISFQDEAYTRLAGLEIEPQPDSLLRVFMAYKPLAQAIPIEAQELQPFARAGFSVVEWGGSRVGS